MRALIIVDVQNDFCEGGALPVKGGKAVAQGIADLLESDDVRDAYEVIVVSQDWHEPMLDNGGHFSSEPDYVDTWPPHCVQGTEGALLHSAVSDAAKKIKGVEGIIKGMGEPAYSAFEGQTVAGIPLDDILAEHDVSWVDIVGLAFDYCVRATALDAKKLGLQTRVLTRYTAPVSVDRAADVTIELMTEGIDVV